MKRYLKLFCFLFLCMLCLVIGCSTEQNQEVEQKRNKKVELIVWAWDDMFNVKAVELAKQEYEKEHSNIEIRVVSKERKEILEKLYNGLDASVYEDLPDILLIEDYEIQKCLARYSEEFVDLSNRMDKKEFVDYKTEAVSYEGHLYGIPFDSGTAVMFYRKDYIEKVGYTEEDMENLTWEKYIEIGRVLKEKEGIRMLTLEPKDLGILRTMMQSAGSWYWDEEKKQVTIENNQALYDATEIYSILLKEGLAYTITGWNESVKGFQEGKVASLISGCWIASTIKESEEQSGLWRVARIPRMANNPKSVNASNNGGSSWYILKKKQNAKEATDFMVEMFTDREFINKLVDEINLVSTCSWANTLENYQKQDEFFGGQNILKIFDEAMHDTLVVNYGMYTYEMEEIFAQELQTMVKMKNWDVEFHKAQVKSEAIIGK